MRVEIYKKAKKRIKTPKGEITNYGLAKQMQKMGLDISMPALHQYDNTDAKSMRLDALCALRKLSGVDWAEYGKWLDEEFLKGKK